MAKIVLLTLLAFAFAAQPEDPVWPNTWSAEFEEVTEYPIIGTHSMKGTFYYDFSTERYRIDRDNGRWDRYCGANGVKLFENTPCNQYVVDGVRYLHYPDKQECCNCCDAAHGCGILKPTWMTGAEYLGETTFNGENTYKWNQKGLQDNFYYETIADEPLDRMMLGLNQQPDDNMTFPKGRDMAVPSGVLDLPKECSLSKKCSFFSVCRAVG